MTCGGGSNLEVSFHADTLFASTRYLLSGDANCCARAKEIKPIVVNGKHVKPLPTQIRPSVGGAAQTVFYLFLDSRDFKPAYDMLSVNYRRKHPYNKWLVGFHNMEHVNVELMDNPHEPVIPVRISSTDMINGSIVHHLFVGAWKVRWVTSFKGNDWVLDDPSIEEVK